MTGNTFSLAVLALNHFSKPCLISHKNYQDAVCQKYQQSSVKQTTIRSLLLLCYEEPSE